MKKKDPFVEYLDREIRMARDEVQERHKIGEFPCPCDYYLGKWMIAMDAHNTYMRLKERKKL